MDYAQLVGVLAVSPVLGGVVAVAGKWLQERVRGEGAESQRLWARVEGLEKKLDDGELQIMELREERIHLLEQLAEGASIVREATSRHHAEQERLERKLDATEAAHKNCTADLAKMRAELKQLTAKVRKVDREVKAQRRDSEPGLHAVKSAD